MSFCCDLRYSKRPSAISYVRGDIDWRQVCRNSFALRYDSGKGMVFISEEHVNRIQREYLDLKDRLSCEYWENDDYRKEMLIAADGICIMAEVSAKLAGYHTKRVTDTERWLEQYSNSWLRKNKPSELHRIREMFAYIS